MTKDVWQIRVHLEQLGYALCSHPTLHEEAPICGQRVIMDYDLQWDALNVLCTLYIVRAPLAAAALQTSTPMMTL